jgi:hypothetical protein
MFPYGSDAVNCEILRKSGSIGVGGIMNKKFGGLSNHFSNLESNSKKRASSEGKVPFQIIMTLPHSL